MRVCLVMRRGHGVRDVPEAEAYLYFESAGIGDRALTLVESDSNLRRAYESESPLQAEATKFSGGHGVMILRIGGNRQVYVIIANGDEGIASLFELAPAVHRLRFVTTLLKFRASIEHKEVGEIEVAYFEWEVNHLLGEIAERMPKLTGAKESFALVNITTLPNPLAAKSVSRPGCATPASSADSALPPFPPLGVTSREGTDGTPGAEKEKWTD